MTTDKPRICEVLGVDVGERFHIVDHEAGYDSADLTVNEVGDVVSVGSAAKLPSAILAVHAINHPESLIRRPRFTEDEIATMRVLYAAGAQYVARDFFCNCLCWFEEKPEMPDGVVFSTSCHGGDLPHSLFPSIRPGQAVALVEVIGDAK